FVHAIKLLSFILNCLALHRMTPVVFPPAQCPPGWVHLGRNCYRTWRKGKAWYEAGRACRTAATGAHLVNIETEEEFLFVTSYLQSFSPLVLLWTGLSDVEVIQRIVSSDGDGIVPSCSS
uniref:C-type lectin domain-containing protein n=1 Tax=Scleropages formosus TaxID=113540 RepID=A0A8C9RE05_SCLFO